MPPKAKAKKKSSGKRKKTDRCKAIARKKVHRVMHEYKHGSLHSGRKTGPLVKSRPQAVAIALSEAKREKWGAGCK